MCLRVYVSERLSVCVSVCQCACVSECLCDCVFLRPCQVLEWLCVYESVRQCVYVSLCLGVCVSVSVRRCVCVSECLCDYVFLVSLSMSVSCFNCIVCVHVCLGLCVCVCVFVFVCVNAGKGTQCSKITQEYRAVKHLSAGDLLRMFLYIIYSYNTCRVCNFSLCRQSAANDSIYHIFIYYLPCL